MKFKWFQLIHVLPKKWKEAISLHDGSLENHLLLVFKYYIFKSRSNKHPSFLQIKTDIIKVKTLEEDLSKGDSNKSKKYRKWQKVSDIFGLTEIGFIVKKENELHLFYSGYLIFYLIPKIYFNQYGWGVVVKIIFFSSFFFHYIYNNDNISSNGNNSKNNNNYCCYYY